MLLSTFNQLIISGYSLQVEFYFFGKLLQCCDLVVLLLAVNLLLVELIRDIL